MQLDGKRKKEENEKEERDRKEMQNTGEREREREREIMTISDGKEILKSSPEQNGQWLSLCWQSGRFQYQRSEF